MYELILQLFAEDPTPPATDPTPPADDTLSEDEMLAQLGDEAAKARIEASRAAEDPTPPAEDPTPPATPTSTKPKPNPIKEVRDQLNSLKQQNDKVNNTIQRFTDGDYEFKLKDFKDEKGVIDYDKVIEAMDAEDVKRTAEGKGISPELQAEINRIEAEKLDLQRKQLQVRMDAALVTLQQEMGIKSSEVNKFFADAMAKKYNPYLWLAQGGNLEDLYITVYRDELLQREIDNAVTKAVEAAKAQWDADAVKKNRQPANNPATPTPTPAVPEKDALQMSALMEALNKK